MLIYVVWNIRVNVSFGNNVAFSVETDVKNYNISKKSWTPAWVSVKTLGLHSLVLL